MPELAAGVVVAVEPAGPEHDDNPLAIRRRARLSIAADAVNLFQRVMRRFHAPQNFAAGSIQAERLEMLLVPNGRQENLVADDRGRRVTRPQVRLPDDG